MNGNGAWRESKDDLVSITTNYFTNLFTSNNPSNQDMERVTSNIKAKLSEHLVRYLEVKFTAANVEKAVLT